MAPICSFYFISLAYELQQELLRLYSSTNGAITGNSGLTSLTISIDCSDSSDEEDDDEIREELDEAFSSSTTFSLVFCLFEDWLSSSSSLEELTADWVSSGLLFIISLYSWYVFFFKVEF